MEELRREVCNYIYIYIYIYKNELCIYYIYIHSKKIISMVEE